MPLTVDIGFLVIALESQPGYGEFYLDRKSGRIFLISDYTDEDADSQRQKLEREPDRFLNIEPMPSYVGWDIMDDFLGTVENIAAKGALERALHGRKPFRSFKDKLLRYPDIREQWFAYQAQRMEALARLWLEEHDISFVLVNSLKPIPLSLSDDK